MPRMIAAKRFEHAGRSLSIGEQFDCNARYVRLLEATGKARQFSEPVQQMSVSSSEPSDADEMLSTDEAVSSDVGPDQPRTRRRYRRRDMRAEGF